MSLRYFNLIFLALSLHSLPALSADLVKVLVVDTGVDTTESALSDMFCPSSDSLDAISGKRRIPVDLHGHGTHVAGIIRALAGDSGYCLAFCKYYVPNINNLTSTIKCLKHAKTIKAKFINYSSGGGSSSPKEKTVLSTLSGFIAVAAGNDHEDIDARGYYPAAYHLPNLSIIGSYDNRCVRSSTSNFGRDVQYYLGDNVYSSLPGGRRGFMGGTSMATAVATGTALRAYLGLPAIGTCQGYWDFLRAFWTSH